MVRGERATRRFRVPENKPSAARSWFRVKFIPRVKKENRRDALNPFAFLRSDHGMEMEQAGSVADHSPITENLGANVSIILQDYYKLAGN